MNSAIFSDPAGRFVHSVRTAQRTVRRVSLEPGPTVNEEASGPAAIEDCDVTNITQWRDRCRSIHQYTKQSVKYWMTRTEFRARAQQICSLVGVKSATA
jgi:hypothetical protein